MPDASIVIPAHNEAGYIGPTVAAFVEAAAGLELEIIVVDDASSDGTSARE